MNNIHPLFHGALRGISQASLPLQPYAVTLRMADKTEVVNILGINASDAITRAIDIYFDGEDQMPFDGLAIDAKPMNLLRSAA